MAEMTAQEIAYKTIHDKAFLRELVLHLPQDEEGDNKDAAQDSSDDGKPEKSIGEVLMPAIEDMGFEGIDTEEFCTAINNEIEQLSGLRRIMFLGSFINAGRKAKKARK